ncbi:MAG TPA: shikimate kinase [Gemmataceae bacterium]
MTPHPAGPARRIFLIGYRGTGKSTVGRRLAEVLGWAFLDADAELEARHGKTIRTIFAEEGEAGFRDKEEALLGELSAGEDRVIATGGGVVLRPANRERLRAGFVVWLRARPETIWERLRADPTTAERRPDLSVGGREEVEQLLRQREPLYAQCADFTADTDDLSPEQITLAILSAWGSSSTTVM